MIEGVSYGRRETTTFVRALRVTGFTAPLPVHGLPVHGLPVHGLPVDDLINGYIFLTWIRQHFDPTLAPEDIVVMDQLSSHKVKGVR